MFKKIVFAAISLAIVSAASANTTLTLNGETDYSQTVSVYDDQLASPAWINVYASPEYATLNINGHDKHLTVFCDDLAHFSVENTTMPVTIEDTNNLGANYKLAAQYYNYFEPSIHGNVMDEAALQLTIWHTIFNSSFSGNSSLQSLASTYQATDVSGASTHAAVYDFHGANQNMLGSAQAVPEPCSMLALGAGAIGLFRRRSK